MDASFVISSCSPVTIEAVPSDSDRPAPNRRLILVAGDVSMYIAVGDVDAYIAALMTARTQAVLLA